MSPVSSDERTKIMSMHHQGIENTQIAAKLELPLRTVGSVVAWEKIRNRPTVQTTAEESEEVETAIEATFGLERDMQSALRKNIEQLEKGLKIADDGKEHIVPSGRIDILAVDSKKGHVVIELKAGTADRDAVGQILSYIGDLQANGRRAIRGILVAADFTGRAIAASKAVPNVELRKYGFTFSFQKVKQVA